jgi:hypothetical protein
MTAAAMAARPRPTTGNEMDTYAADVAELTEHLDLKNADPRRPLHRRRRSRPLCRPRQARPRRQGGADRRRAAVMVKTEKNPGGLPIEVFDGFRAALAANRAQFYRRCPGRPVLRLQPAGREGLAGRDRQLVAAGHDGRRQGPLRLHQGLLGDRLHRGPEGDRRAGARHARRGRPDRADRRFGPALGQAAEERHAEDLWACRTACAPPMPTSSTRSAGLLQGSTKAVGSSMACMVRVGTVSLPVRSLSSDRRLTPTGSAAKRVTPRLSAASSSEPT